VSGAGGPRVKLRFRLSDEHEEALGQARGSSWIARIVAPIWIEQSGPLWNMSKPKKVALYLRVSTERQSVDNQRQALSEAC